MRMRVQDQEQEQEQEQDLHQAPFRVLSPGGRILYKPRPVLRSPPPARAPDPYKLAPQAIGCGRSQRKSSFAIIAEAQTLTPPSRPSSGRLSPFRGRGFKGPPPRSSFPNGAHSPPDESSQCFGHSKPARASPTINSHASSFSQYNSPKRSLIPLADPNRSVSSSIGASPRFGRRATHRYTSSIGNSDANHRQPSHRESKRRPELSPISSASKRKSTEKGVQKIVPKSFRAQRTTKSEERLNKKLLISSKNVPDSKRFITAKTPVSRHKFTSTEALNSPSKIPLMRAPITGSLAKTTPIKSTSTTMKNTLNKPIDQLQIQTQSKKSDDASNTENIEMVSNNENLILKEGIPLNVEEELGLVDLLKQTSGATGTSSVVNTTTTTAVQPLQIDAASILAEGELVAKLTSLEKMQKSLDIDDESIDNQKSSQSKKNQKSEIKTNSSQNEQTTLPSSIHNQIVKTDLIEDKVNEVNVNNSKNSNLTQTMIKHFGPNSSTEDQTLSNNLNNITSDQTKVTEKTVNMMTEIEKSKEKLNKQLVENEDSQRETSTLTSNHIKTDNKINNGKDISKSINSVNDSKKVSPSSTTNIPAYEIEDIDEKINHLNRAKINNETSLKLQVDAVSSESLGSSRSNDTGVSVNTVKGISSAKEKTGLHLIKRSDEIETLSGNIVHIDKNIENAVPSNIIDNTEGVRNRASSVTTRWQRLKEHYWNRFGCKKQEKGIKSLVGGCCCNCWSKMRCFACKRGPKAQLWTSKQAKGISTMQLTADQRDKPLTKWEKLKDTCRCGKVRESRWCNWRQRRWQRQQHRQVVPADLDKSCCPAKGNLAGFCRNFFSCCSCLSKKSQRAKTVRTKHSLTSVAAPPLSEETRPKIPDVLVEHNSLMRGAIPCLPIPIAWFCLMWNVLLPGSGTIFSGFFNVCLGQPRFSAVASLKARFGALIVNFVVGISQLFTVLFCLVGWGWSIWWGVTMIRLARKYKRFKDSEAVANDPEARGGPETATLPAPGVPTHGLRGVERTR